jgi:hypothetical protein
MGGELPQSRSCIVRRHGRRFAFLDRATHHALDIASHLLVEFSGHGEKLAASVAGRYQVDMPLRSYNDLVDEIPNAHLVVGTVGRIGRPAADTKELAAAAVLIKRLLAALDPRGDYAVGEMADGDDFAVHAVFALKADADRLADAVQARTVGRYAGWSSQRAFRLDPAARKVIAAALAGGAGRKG